MNKQWFLTACLATQFPVLAGDQVLLEVDSGLTASSEARSGSVHHRPISSAPDAQPQHDGQFSVYPNDNRVEYGLKKGPLMPQVMDLLLKHERIASADDIHWQASENFQWPNQFTLKGPTIDHLINDVLKPYDLLAEFTGNGNVVIKKP